MGASDGAGSARCILCNAELENAGISAYDELVQRNAQAEYAARRTAITAAKTFGVLMLVFAICFGFFLIRVSTAEQRAKQLAEDFLTDRVSNLENVEFQSGIGSCLDGGFVSEGFELTGICRTGGWEFPVSVIVRMEGIFDSGEVVYADIAGRRLK